MSYFTESPFERMMVQKPREVQQKRISTPKGHLCYGCERCGMYCIRPCCKEVKAEPGKVVILCG